MDSPRTPRNQKIVYVSKTPRKQQRQTIGYMDKKKLQHAATKELVHRTHHVPDEIAERIAHQATKSHTQKKLF